MPDAAIEQRTDAITETNTTNICGSDLHTYEDHPYSEEGTMAGAASRSA